MIIRVIGVAAACFCLPPAAAPRRRGQAGRARTAMGGPGYGPGSQQDLAATAGDRVFFAYDQSDISSEGQQILQRQAEWLKRYPTRHGHDRGPLRRARHARIQPRARRAPRRGGQERAGRARHPGGAHPDDQLRQGAADRRRVETRTATRRTASASPPSTAAERIRGTQIEGACRALAARRPRFA